MKKGYEIPALQGETALQRAVSLMLRRYLQSHPGVVHEDPAVAPGVLALRFAWWLFDHPEELEAATVEMEARMSKQANHRE